MAERTKIWLEISFPADEDRPDDMLDPESAWSHYVMAAVAAVGGFTEKSPALVENMSCDRIWVSPPGVECRQTAIELLEQALDNLRDLGSG